MPETKVTTAITAATPITTPSSVSTERNLFAHSDCSAIRMASATFMGQVSGLRSWVLGFQSCRYKSISPIDSWLKARLNSEPNTQDLRPEAPVAHKHRI